MGMHLSEKIDCGIKLGHYVFNRDGDLYDSKWGIYPHYSFAELDDESLKIDGNHIEVGLGLNVHFNPKTHLGLSGGLMQGSGKEVIASLDTSDYWSERDTDPKYHNISYSYLKSRESFDSEGDRTYFTLNFEKQLSPKLIFRSFFQIIQKKIDIEGMKVSSDTTYGDRTYDYYDTWDDHFRRRESHSSRENDMNGSGQEKTNQWKWFGSMVYTPEETWSLFGGLLIQRASMSRELGESSGYRSHSWTEYSIYKPETQENNYSEEKVYEYKDHSLQWSAWIPIGIQIEVVKGLRLLLGTDVSLRLSDEDSDGKLLYPYIINKKQENGKLVVDDEEVDRYEEFHSDPAKEFNRQIGNRFGLTYQHSIGLKLFISSYGDLFQVDNWAFGLQMNW